MSELGSVKVPVQFEMTDTSKAMLKTLILEILKDKALLHELVKAIEESQITRIHMGKPL